MLSIRATITGGPRAIAAQLKRDTRAELSVIGRQWHRGILPRHFDTAAGARYGYKPRKRRYQIRKAKSKGHQKPLVWSGRLQKDIRSFASVTGTAKAVSVRMKGPRYLYAYRKKQGAPNLRAEITALTSAEHGALAKSLAWGLAGRMKANKTREALAGGIAPRSGRMMLGTM